MPCAAILLTLLLFSFSPARPQDPQAPEVPGSMASSPLAETRQRDARPVASPPVMALSGSAVLDFFPSASVTPAAPDTLFGESAEEPRGEKSSWTAVGLSAVLPGAGQVYTENYWKVPLIWGLGGYWVYEWTKNNDRYREFRDLYNRSTADSPPYGDDRYLRLREAYKDQRDSFSWYLGILYFLNVVDAYVGAELYDFDVGPDLGSGGGGMHASLRIHL